MVGDILRSEREKQGLTIKDIENETSIRALYIDAIEKGNQKALPSEVYVKGFIRNYAEFLRLDADLLARQYLLLFWRRSGGEAKGEPCQLRNCCSTGNDGGPRRRTVCLAIGIQSGRTSGGISDGGGFSDE